MSKKKESELEKDQPTLRYAYRCPACTQDAIQTSNLMLGVHVDCMNCGMNVLLDNEGNYKKL